MPWSLFSACCFKPTFSLSSFTYIKRLFSSSLLSAIRVVSSAYLRLLIFLLAILIPACASSSPEFCMTYSVCKLNKQGDWCTPFPIWKQTKYACHLLRAIIKYANKNFISSVQSLRRVRLFATPWIAARQASLSTTNSRSSLRLTSIESVIPSSHLILCYPLLLLPPIPPSIRVFSNESTLHMSSPGQSTGISTSASSSPKKSQGWSPSEWTGWISLQSKGLSRVFSNTTVQKHQFFGAQLSSQSNSHIHTWPLDIPFIKRSYIAPCFRAWIRGQVAWVGRITKSKLDASHQCTVKPIYWCRVVVKESIVFMHGI